MSYLDEGKPMTLRQLIGLEAVRDHPAIVWWRPPVRAVIRQIPYRWLLLLFLAGSLALIVAAHFSTQHRTFLFYLGIKLLVISLLIPIVTWDHYCHRAIRARTDPFCLHCGWTLIGLPSDGRCPECGEPYRDSVIEMYRHDPQWVRAYWQFDRRPPSVLSFNSAHPPAPRGC